MIFLNKVITTSYRIRRILKEADAARKNNKYVNEQIYSELKQHLEDRFLFIVVYPIRKCYIMVTNKRW